ncbi:MAG: hypothetical protein GY801_28940 [bacterium]|nr:hypothetical protein [bacterium]
MAQGARIVGKYTLESLTTGMYAENRIIFREYIQNSSDAIDKAIAQGVLRSRDDARIDISIDLERRRIGIRDNGIGMSAQDVYHGLGDIGNSQKSYRDDRGFRGIGRLGGLGYCVELEFITSFKGEASKTITRWDCRELKRLLQPNVGERMSLMDVVEAVTTLEEKPEEADEHYFEVVLSGIAQGHENLLDLNDVKNYLSQVAPVPFNYQNLSSLQEVNEKLIALGQKPEEFPIFVHYGRSREQIYKPYKRAVRAGKTKGGKDHIKEIKFFESYNGDGALFFVGWYAVTDLSGIVQDDSINGLRVRKRNILIGDNRTLDTFFGEKSYQVYNRWFVGEIYVFDEDLLPNARRDDFEKTSEAYFKFKKEIEKTTKDKLARLPHSFSDARSNEKRIHDTSKTIEELQERLVKGGITETRKEKLLKKAGDAKKRVEGIKPTVYTKMESEPAHEKNDSVVKEKIVKTKRKKEALTQKLENVENIIRESNNYIPLPSGYSRDVKSVVKTIFEVIDKTLPEGQAHELQERIIEELKVKGKEKDRT